MLSFRPPSFRSHSPIDCYMKSHPQLFLHGPYRPHQDRRPLAAPMHIKTWSLDSMSEPLVLADTPPSTQPFNNRTCHDEPFPPSSASTSRFMAHKRNQPVQPRSVSYPSGSSNPISSFELEYALLEHTLRKDRRSSSFPKEEDEGKPHKCASPPLLEPEFYFGDILGDEAIPPQPLVSICKDEDKIQPEEEDHVEMPENFVNYGHRLPLSDNNQLDSPGSNHPETDLSTALASLVSSHVSNESVSPKHVAQHSGRPAGMAGSQKKTAGSVKRRAPESSLERQTKFARPIRNQGWPEVRTSQEQFSQLESNQKSVTDLVTSDLLRNERATVLQHMRMHGSGEILRVGEVEPMMHSPVSDSSMSGPGPSGPGGPGVRSHPDLYENLSADIREKVDRLREKISAMPRRKLRESLARGVTLEDVEPLMCLNRDELAGMLGMGVTTLKMFVHNTLGVPRWPARALKSQQVKVQKLVQKRMEAERKGDQEQVQRVQRDLSKMTKVQMRRKRNVRKDGMRKQEGATGMVVGDRA